jgi:hypothetical protein
VNGRFQEIVLHRREIGSFLIGNVDLLCTTPPFAEPSSVWPIVPQVHQAGLCALLKFSRNRQSLFSSGAIVKFRTCKDFRMEYFRFLKTSCQWTSYQ